MRRSGCSVEVFVLISSLAWTSPVWAQAEYLFHDTDLGVSVSVPAGWSKDTSRPIVPSILANFRRGNSEITLQSFAVEEGVEEMRGFLSGTEFDLLGYERFYLSKTDWLAKAIEEPRKIVIGNTEAVVSLSEQTVFGLMKLKVLDYVFYDSKRKRTYHLRLYSPEDSFETDNPDFLSAVNSFTIE